MGPLGLRVGSSDEGLVQVGERAVAYTQEYFGIQIKLRIKLFSKVMAEPYYFNTEFVFS